MDTKVHEGLLRHYCHHSYAAHETATSHARTTTKRIIESIKMVDYEENKIMQIKNSCPPGNETVSPKAQRHPRHWLANYKVKETLGQGNFGKVKVGIDNKGQKVALKVRTSENDATSHISFLTVYRSRKVEEEPLLDKVPQRGMYIDLRHPTV